MTILSCLYCEELSKDPQNIDSVIELYNIAYSCRIQYLMEQCVVFFDKIISPENVGKFFVETRKKQKCDSQKLCRQLRKFKCEKSCGDRRVEENDATIREFQDRYGKGRWKNEFFDSQ